MTDIAPFSAVSALKQTGSGRFTADLHPLWSIGGRPNGGYLLALMGRAATAVSQHAHVIAASAHYLHSPVPGPVTVQAEVLRAGRSASQLRVRMAQDDHPCVEALITASRLEPGVEAYWDRGAPAPGVAERDACERLPGVNPLGVPVPIMEQVDLRIEPASSGFTAGEPTGAGVLRGWLELPAGEPFDPVSLLYAVDAFPPGTFDIELTGWVPTLELSVYVRALPSPGPVRVLQQAGVIAAQRVDEACHVWDTTGRLVAHSTQLAGVRLG